jgi:hypothetical protein
LPSAALLCPYSIFFFYAYSCRPSIFFIIILRRCLRDINAQHHIAQVTTKVSNHQPAMIIATCTHAIAASTVVLHLPGATAAMPMPIVTSSGSPIHNVSPIFVALPASTGSETPAADGAK